MKNLFKRLKKLGRGQSLVEMALILPVLILLFLGLIELGLMMRAYLVVVNANREGARLAGRGVYTDEQIAGYTLNAFSDQLPARTVNNPTVGIIITRLKVEVETDGSHTSSWEDPAYVTGTLQTGDPETDERILNELLIDPVEELARLEAETIAINEGLSKEEGAVATDHSMVVVEVLYQHPQYLHAPIFEWIFPDPMLLYSKTAIREGGQGRSSGG